ncbi:nuclear transport factor 2 family protein [Microbispora sp. ZYX-F-249]|uniref:Nuclear transport factor 2 family protein n=1 Tax=Microbispora maris TaxID=3144104 RepID=A0ABV0AQX4_9ACTN
MDLDWARAFAATWADEWNAHDLDRVMRHYADDVVFRSPIAARLIEGSDGVIRGKDALRAYWAEGLRRNPDLRFEVVGVYAGIDCVVINFRKETGALASEVLVLEDDLIVSGWGTHGAE